MYSQVLQKFGDVALFLENHDDLGKPTRTKLVVIMRQPHSKAVMQLELAAVLDMCSYFVKATYSPDLQGSL